ncbi:MsnO8 family LLM class oxidoreductase [Sphingobacterium sp. SRCM116780]|uniref:MsnO8 family LLM class oxidoreductase n=1 Tax=Sphingobacterium sp. SRCM116780 TaxID=2907623 RepID=UPI001F25B723|nr:MsnO8 family LLM class oxidoreductase [Sphingobacterium sp. SRCM116780]UIR54987.1 MsnO8 family LLM class oxidoreductase [Sphingobacterium sp. SRCM116780]
MKISILDQAPISKGISPAQALKNMEAGAIFADKLGYHRFWIAEHHNSYSLASSAPEISMAYLSGKTERIRFGSGGTMMMHYSPYKMAEVFKTLSAFAPGRIDFGGGRAPGGDGKAIYALSEGRDSMHQELYSKFYNTLQLIQDQPGLEATYQNIIAHPQQIVLPEPFMLGSSGNSAAQAGHMGVGYAYVQFFNGKMDPTTFDTYKQYFQPSAYFEKPYSLVCYFVTVGNTKEEAEYQGLPADIARMLLHRGQNVLRLSPEDAQNFPLSEMDKANIKENSSWHIKGTVKEVTDHLLREQELYGFDEIMICTIPYDHQYKLWEYEMIAKALL